MNLSFENIINANSIWYFHGARFLLISSHNNLIFTQSSYCLNRAAITSNKVVIVLVTPTEEVTGISLKYSLKLFVGQT